MTAVRQRLLKYLKRLLIVLLVLGALGVAAFTWFCYWPLEGEVDDLLNLVPEDVEFVLRGNYEDIEATGWIQENVIDNPLHPDMRRPVEEGLEEARVQMAEIERQINANIPSLFDSLHFNVEEDVLKGEMIAAGRFCRGPGPDQGGPKWQEILILKRVSMKTRCVAALKHRFIREGLGPNLQASSEADDVFKLVFPNVPPLTVRERSGCGDGFVIPPQNVWYLRRVKDVIAVSNSERLVRAVAGLAESGDGTGSFGARPGFDVEAQSGKIVAAINIEPLHSYLKRIFTYWPDLKPIRSFLEPAALKKLSGSISLEGTDLLEGSAQITTTPAQARELWQNVYSLPERSMREGIAQMVPAKDTFAVLSLRCDPEYLLTTLYNDMLTAADRRLWNQNLKSTEYDTVEDFFRDLATRISDEAMIALSRLSVEFDNIHPKEFFDETIDPRPGLAVMVRIKEGANQDELDAYLAEKVPLLGMSKELVKVEYRGFKYSRAELVAKTLDYALVSPCFILARDHLILTNNEGYMRQILDAVSDAKTPTLAEDETYQVTMARLASRGHIGLFADMEKLTRIPEDVENDRGAPGTRGLLWDRRNLWVRANKDGRAEAIRYRHELQKRYPRRLSPQQEDAIEDKVDAHMESWRESYSQFTEEWRRQLDGLRRIRGLGLVIGARGETLDVDFATVLRQGERWLRWQR